VVRIDRFLTMKPPLMIPGHGKVSPDPVRDLAFTQDYIRYLGSRWGRLWRT
jgi:hypothetical protein